MNPRLLFLSLALSLGLLSCNASPSSVSVNSNKSIPDETDALVCYFSRTNNTERIASYIAELTSSSTYEIEAKVP